MNEPVTVKSYSSAPDGTSAVLLFESTQPGLHFARSTSWTGAQQAQIVEGTESDESLRQHHYSDTGQVDAIRRARTRYAVVNSIGGTGQAKLVALVTEVVPDTVAHELGHTAGLLHTGHAAWKNVPTNCMPHYRSLMSYAVPGIAAFSAVDSPVQLNPAQAQEYLPFGPNYPYSSLQSAPFFFGPATGAQGVDWNRDGQLSAGGWRSAPLVADWGGCHGYGAGKTMLDPAANVRGGVDLVRYAGKLWALWATPTGIWVRSAPLGPAGAKGCTGSADPKLGDCLAWSAPALLVAAANIGGVTAFAHDTSMFVAANLPSVGLMTVWQFSELVGGGVVMLSEVVLPEFGLDSQTAFTPELALRNHLATNRKLALLYLSRSGSFREYSWDGANWIYDGALLRTDTGAPIPGGEAPVAKDWPDASVAGWSDLDRRTLAMFPDQDKVARLFLHDHATNRWQPTGLSIGPTSGKPFLEFSPIRDTTGLPNAEFAGHFLAGRSAPCIGGVCPFVHRSTLVSFSDPPAAGPGASFAMTPPADFLLDMWSTVQTGSTTALYGDATTDNVFGLTASAADGFKGVAFLPHADGAPDSVFTVYSDFRVMEEYICKQLGDLRSHWCGNAAGNLDLNVLD